MNAANAPATVRISGPPNSSFLVGYPGISATLVSAAGSESAPMTQLFCAGIVPQVRRRKLLVSILLLTATYAAQNNRQSRDSARRRILGSGEHIHGAHLSSTTRDDTSSRRKCCETTSRDATTRNGRSGGKGGASISLRVGKGG